MWRAPEGGKGNSQNTRNVCPWLLRGQFLYLQGGLPSGAGLESQASSLTSLSPWASQPRPQNSFPLAARSQCLEQRACAQQSRSGQARRRGWFHEAVSNPELGRWEGHPHPVRAVMVDRVNWQQSCSGEPGSTQGKGLK